MYLKDFEIRKAYHYHIKIKSDIKKKTDHMRKLSFSLCICVNLNDPYRD